MIGEMIYCTHLIDEFIKETGYHIKPKDAPIEVDDAFYRDKKTGEPINYGNINDIMNSEEFRLWFKKKEGLLNND